jgi:hypothetical protein
MKRNTSRAALALALGWMLQAATPAHAAYGFGPRVGFGLQPDQFVVGAQTLLGRSLYIFRFAPSFDLGWGDEVTTYAFNGDFEFQLGVPSTRARFYVGGGVGVTAWDFEASGSDTEVGLNLLGGARLAGRGSMEYTVEARFGVGDIPDFRLLFGVLLGSGEPAPEGTSPQQ